MSQPLIPKDGRSGLLMDIAMMESGCACGYEVDCVSPT